MKRLHHMKEKLICCVECQMSHLETVNTKELGEAIDMIKDLSEAIYYCTITEAMETPAESEMKGMMYYDEKSMPPQLMADGHGTWHNTERDEREGRSGHVRKSYMEGKAMHADKAHQMKELEKYAQELTTDLIEMIENATPEEKQFLSSKIATLATHIK